MSIRPLFLALFALAACNGRAQPRADADIRGSEFPKADRPVAPITSSRWSTEEARDRVQEAARVMDAAGLTLGMTVADIGAGEGYYTVRLAERVGPKGRVVAQDVVPDVQTRLAERVYREQLGNVYVKLGGPADPMLPADQSFDRVFMIHMYHEIEAPYEFLWRLRPSLKKGGQVVIVDNDRPTVQHGTPLKLLQCELAAVGFRLRETKPLQPGVYLALFEMATTRPAPRAIKPCTI